jgi:dUTP pyrophosphatase
MQNTAALERSLNTKIPSNGINYLANPVHWVKMVPQAEAPFKERLSDVGWNVTLIGRVDNRIEDTIGEVNMYHTGIQLVAPSGYHFELVALSNLYKTGYMLASGLTIIDPEYRGELLVPLFKYKEAEDLELPFRAVQLVLRETVHAHVLQAKNLQDDVRNSDPFASSVYNPPSQQYTATVRSTMPSKKSELSLATNGGGKSRSSAKVNHMF